MQTTDIGIVSHITRVETWECDFNGHWNTRFYTRAFQQASETIALLEGSTHRSPPSDRVTRHIRFHRELLAGAPVLVRSAVVHGGPWDGAVTHWLESEGRLSATALDTSGCTHQHLPPIEDRQAKLALPKGLVNELPPGSAEQGNGRGAYLGVLRPSDCDHTGALTFDELYRYLTYASHDHHVSLGYSPSFTATTGISRMVVETRATWLGQARAGTGMRSTSWLLHAQGKSFSTAHQLEALNGTPIALIELFLVAVDLQSRRSTQVPDFLLDHSRNGSHSSTGAS